MVPAANLIGFAGQELARKLPKVFGILLETTLGSVVEIILFMVLLTKNQISVVKAAILGSILANLLLCLGACFIFGGLKHNTQTFNEIVSEVGSGLMLVAGLGLLVPSAFFSSLKGIMPTVELEARALSLSRIVAVCFLVAYAM
jgi:Ca2+:H+ antiporter